MRKNAKTQQISDASFALLEDLRAQTGMIQKEIVSRLVEFAARVDPSERAIMLGQIHPEDAGKLAEIVIQRLRRETESSVSVTDLTGAELLTRAETSAPSKKTRRTRRPETKSAPRERRHSGDA